VVEWRVLAADGHVTWGAFRFHYRPEAGPGGDR